MLLATCGKIPYWKSVGRENTVQREFSLHIFFEEKKMRWKKYKKKIDL